MKHDAINKKKWLIKINKNIKLIIVVFILLILNILLLYMLYARLIKPEKINIDNNNEITVETNINALQSIILDQYKCENIYLPPEIKFSDIQNNETELAQILNQSPILCIRFTGYGCSSCVDNFEKELDKILKCIKQKKNINIAFFLSMGNIYELKAFKKLYKIDYPVYLVPKMTFPFEVENRDNIIALFCFVLDKDFKAKHFYIPINGFSKLTEEYLSVISERYFLRSY